MEASDLKKRIRVMVMEEGYYDGRICTNGEIISVERFQFSPTWMVAIDEKDEALKTQPKKLDADTVKKAFSRAGEGFKEAEKTKDFPVLGKKELEEASNSGAIDLSGDSSEDVSESDTQDNLEGAGSLI